MAVEDIVSDSDDDEKNAGLLIDEDEMAEMKRAK